MKADAAMNDDQFEDAQDTPENLPIVQDPLEVWRYLQRVPFDLDVLDQNRIVTAKRKHAANRSFDMLRTRLLQTMKEQDWKRVAITSPTNNCGKTFVTANLAVSLSRLEEVFTMVVDLNLRNPGLADAFGIKPLESMQSYLEGRIDPQDFYLAHGRNLGLGLGSAPAENASELFQSTMTMDVLDEMEDLFCPNIVLFDLPPALDHDDLLAFLPKVDAVLLVVGGGVSTTDEIERVEALIAGIKPLAGIVMNKSEGVVSN
ncbi:MAG: CpsD/CapB family tyrosine-protein kinase [Shimia thalassica]|uniref:CpsD/CapB family tyrosine-protein kinase n=2 Tax=Shimia thalassica TaxID=1715693 RepID=UPI0032968C15